MECLALFVLSVRRNYAFAVEIGGSGSSLLLFRVLHLRIIWKINQRQSFNDRSEDSNTRFFPREPENDCVEDSNTRFFPREPENFGVSERNMRGGEILRPSTFTYYSI